MTASRPEVEDMLRKWMSDSSLIHCSIEFDGGVVFGTGKLILQPPGFFIAYEPHFQIAFSLNLLISAEYEDLREAVQPAKDELTGLINGILMLEFPDGIVRLHESAPKVSQR